MKDTTRGESTPGDNYPSQINKLQKTKVFPQLEYQVNLDIADYLKVIRQLEDQVNRDIEYLKVTRQLEDQVNRDIDIEYLKTFLMLQVSKGD